MFKILKIEGDSMYPLLRHGEKIFCIRPIFTSISLGDVVVFKHKNYGLMVKQITKIDKNTYYVKGTLPNSIDSSVFGYLKKSDFLYKMLFRF